MDEIAERAGVSKPVLYQHFPGKLDLYLALLDDSVQALTGTIRDALASTTDNKQRVSATFQAFFDFVASTGEAFRLVFESDLRNEPAVRDRLDAAMRVHADLISEFIREDAGLGDGEAHLLGIGLVGAPVLNQLDRNHRAQATHLTDGRALRLQSLQARHELRAQNA